jgi:MFS family permease
MGFGIFSSPNTNAIMSSVDHKHLGMASAMVSTMRVTGQMLSMGIAALVVHLFLGNARIGVANITDFIGSARIIFIICSILCVIGVFASLTGIKSKLAENDIRLHS